MGGLPFLLDIFVSLVKDDEPSLFALRFLALASQQELSVLNNGIIWDYGCNSWSRINFKYILCVNADKLVRMTTVV